MSKTKILLNEKVVTDFHRNNPTVLKVLEGLVAGLTVKDLAKQFEVKEQSVRNLKHRYKDFIKEVVDAQS